eukprot:3936251-Amphidinium_carterae.1
MRPTRRTSKAQDLRSEQYSKGAITIIVWDKTSDGFPEGFHSTKEKTAKLPISIVDIFTTSTTRIFQTVPGSCSRMTWASANL